MDLSRIRGHELRRVTRRSKIDPPDEIVIGRVRGIRDVVAGARQSAASASFSVLLGRIAADVLALSGR